MKKILKLLKENKKSVAAGIVAIVGLFGAVVAPEAVTEILEGLFAIVDIANAE